MANSIALAEKFLPILDEIYKRESLTARLDAKTKPVEFGGVNEIKIFKTSVVGLGDYSRATGYPAGDVTASWETIALTQERGRAFAIDRMDDEETLGMAFGKLAGEFIRTQVVPEVDAYRFSKWASTANVSTANAAALANAAATLAAIDVASGKLDDDEVPQEGRLLFIAQPQYRQLTAAVNRSLENQSTYDRRLRQLDEMTIIPVPQGRFYTAITTNAGALSNQGGYTKGAAATNLNFILMHPTAVEQATKLANLKIFSPEENQLTDSWLFQYRLYHDAWVYDNKVSGVYIHKSNA
jgi:hypothetical protein